MGVEQVIKLGPVQQDAAAAPRICSAWLAWPYKLMPQHSREQGDAVLQSCTYQLQVLGGFSNRWAPNCRVWETWQEVRRSSSDRYLTQDSLPQA